MPEVEDLQQAAGSVDALAEAAPALDVNPSEEPLGPIDAEEADAERGAAALDTSSPAQEEEKPKVYADADTAGTHDEQGNRVEGSSQGIDEGAGEDAATGEEEVPELPDAELPEVEAPEDEGGSEEEEEPEDEPPPLDGEFEFTDDDGRTHRVTYAEGQLTGPFQIDDADGCLELSGNLLEGVQDGELETYDQGVLQSRVDMVQGVPHGMMSLFDADGRVTAEIPYEDGEKHGEMKTYYPSGKVQSVITYEHDKRNGVMETYSEEGQLMSRVLYKDDKLDGLSENFYTGDSQGLLKSATYVEDVLDGTETLFDAEGKMISETVYDHGEKISTTPTDSAKAA